MNERLPSCNTLLFVFCHTVTDNTNYFPLIVVKIILNSAAKLLAGAEWSGESGREREQPLCYYVSGNLEKGKPVKAATVPACETFRKLQRLESPTSSDNCWCIYV